MKNKILLFYAIILLQIVDISIFASNEGNYKNNNIVTNKYALLINGDRSNLHLTNIEKMHKLLIDLGYDDNKIFILNPVNIRNRSCTIRINNLNANLEMITSVTKYMKDLLTDKDSLFLYITGHGDRNSDNTLSRIVLEGSRRIDQKDFDRLIKQVPFNYLFVVIDCCFSGGIVFELTREQNRKVIAISSTDATHSTYCKFFIQGFINSFYNEAADINGDNKISMKEAYKQASDEHRINLSDRVNEINTQYLFSGEIDDFIIGNLIIKNEINSELEE